MRVSRKSVPETRCQTIVIIRPIKGTAVSKSCETESLKVLGGYLTRFRLADRTTGNSWTWVVIPRYVDCRDATRPNLLSKAWVVYPGNHTIANPAFGELQSLVPSIRLDLK